MIVARCTPLPAAFANIVTTAVPPTAIWPDSRHSGMVRSTRPQMRNCASGNLEIPGSMLRIAPE
jgi:hypothetical protein